LIAPKLIVGLVDYGVGNHASVVHLLKSMGYRCIVSSDPDELVESDLLLLPGVGSFPAAMESLNHFGLVEFIKDQFVLNKPIVGICLGMQLLADSSHEISFTKGLGLIPGSVESLNNSLWHIGWNDIQIIKKDAIFSDSNQQAMYFSHSYVFKTKPEYNIAEASLDLHLEPFTVAVRYNNVIGLQFHPEKSQFAGKFFLRRVIEGLCNA